MPAQQTTRETDESSKVEELGIEIEPKRLADAFEAATGHRRVFITHNSNYSIKTTPIRIIELSFGPVLLTQDTNSGGGIDNVGAIGVHYLRELDQGFDLADSWPRLVMGWGWGAPPKWRLTEKFTRSPAIYAWGDYISQGALISSATITVLRPEGPITSDYIYTGYKASSSQWAGDGAVCSVTGRIANIRKGKSFDVMVTGSRTSVDRYENEGGKIFATRQIHWDVPCGEPFSRP